MTRAAPTLPLPDDGLGPLKQELLNAKTNVDRALQRLEAYRQAGPLHREPLAARPFRERPWRMFAEIHRLLGSTSYSTWFVAGEDGDGRPINIGAAHSVEAWPEDRRLWPKWTKEYDPDDIFIRPGGDDLAIFGDPTSLTVVELEIGDRVLARGFPAGVTLPDHWEARAGTVYLGRDEDGDGREESLIVQYDDGSDSRRSRQHAAVGGMSGGPVAHIDAEMNETLAAVLITRNSPVDTDGDGRPEEGSDVVELAPALRAIRRIIDQRKLTAA